MKKWISQIFLLAALAETATADRIIYTGETTAAERGIPVYLVDATDNETAETGITISAGECRVCKNGGSCGDCAGTWTEAEFGLYDYRATTTEINTVGYITVMVKDTAANVFVGTANIVAYDPSSSTFYAPTGTFQSGSSTSVVILGSADSQNYRKGQTICGRSGNVAGQCSTITKFNSSTKAATIYPAWTNAPANTDTYDVYTNNHAFITQRRD